MQTAILHFWNASEVGGV